MLTSAFVLGCCIIFSLRTYNSVEASCTGKKRDMSIHGVRTGKIKGGLKSSYSYIENRNPRVKYLVVIHLRRQIYIFMPVYSRCQVCPRHCVSRSFELTVFEISCLILFLHLTTPQYLQSSEVHIYTEETAHLHTLRWCK